MIRQRLVLITLLLAVLLAAAGLAVAQTGGGFDLTWNTVDGGGGTSTGGGYTLSGAIGQPDAGAMAGGTFTLEGGFWPGAEPQAGSHDLFLPLVEK